MTFLKGIKLKNTKYLFILFIVIIIVLFIQFSMNKSTPPLKEKVPTPTKIPISPANKKLTEPTSSEEKTYYKTENKCQTDADCVVCAPGNPAYPFKNNCQKGTCYKGICYWVHQTSKCQSGYIKVCEGGICECITQ